MKVKSITFDCPVLFRGKLSHLEEVHAPELNSYISGITYNEIASYFIVVDFNNEQYVIDVIKGRKKDQYNKYISQLSNFLQANVSIIEVLLNDDSTYSLKTIQFAEYKLIFNSVADEIMHKFPKLSIIKNVCNVQEYIPDKDIAIDLSPWINAKRLYLVILPFNGKQYIIVYYTRKSKASSLINKAQLEGAFVVDVEIHNEQEPKSFWSINESDSDIDDSQVEEIKTMNPDDLDSLI